MQIDGLSYTQYMQSDGCDTVPELTLLTPVRVKVRVHIDFDV